MLLVWFLQRLPREGELDRYIYIYLYISISLSLSIQIYLLQVSRGNEDKHDPNISKSLQNWSMRLTVPKGCNAESPGSLPVPFRARASDGESWACSVWVFGGPCHLRGRGRRWRRWYDGDDNGWWWRRWWRWWRWWGWLRGWGCLWVVVVVAVVASLTHGGAASGYHLHRRTSDRKISFIHRLHASHRLASPLYTSILLLFTTCGRRPHTSMCFWMIDYWERKNITWRLFEAHEIWDGQSGWKVWKHMIPIIGPRKSGPLHLFYPFIGGSFSRFRVGWCAGWERILSWKMMLAWPQGETHMVALRH